MSHIYCSAPDCAKLDCKRNICGDTNNKVKKSNQEKVAYSYYVICPAYERKAKK